MGRRFFSHSMRFVRKPNARPEQVRADVIGNRDCFESEWFRASKTEAWCVMLLLSSSSEKTPPSQ